MRLLALLGLALLPLGAAADTIVLRADPWCPYNCQPGSDLPGYMVELAREALEPYGHDVRYETVSWARGLVQAETGEINGVIGAVPEETPSFVFGPPMGTYSEVLVFRAGETREVAVASDLDGLRIGAINGYEHSDIVMAAIEANREDRSVVQFASGDDALSINLRKLVAGRVDVVADTRAVVEYTISRLGLQGQIEMVDDPDIGEIFIAFSPALEVSETYAAQLTEGIARLKATGRYDEILARYGLG